MSGKCSGLLTMLLSEAVREMNISEVLTLPSDWECCFPFHLDCVPFLNAAHIYDGLHSTALSRFSAMLECSFYATLPLVCGWVGKFSEEVVEVVRIADLLRRYDAHCYISVRHILLAVIERTAVDAVKQLVTEALSTCSSECAKLPPYDIYLSSSNLAKKLGAAKVSLDHLAIAAVRKGADLCRKMCYDVSSEESAVKFLNENCKLQPESDCSKDSICCEFINWDDVKDEAGWFCYNVHFFGTTSGLMSFLGHAERLKHEKLLWNNDESSCGTKILDEKSVDLLA
ncbi:Glycoside hydrolase, family 5 [Quillaja saponaria]|uniref:Glycoside hydrolase, family 5 n=1 Tax=Quillaja saponaria TaxID=32244 RepID=A0AAD7PQW3_QUISA|nr:Glycoside hydrolase, family 5 [Quillaja saponaria]